MEGWTGGGMDGWTQNGALALHLKLAVGYNETVKYSRVPIISAMPFAMPVVPRLASACPSACMLLLLATVASALLLTGCLPYATGTTAHPVDEADGPVASTTVYTVPNGPKGIDTNDQDEAVGYMGFDTEIRFGINEQTDVGVRLPGVSGVVVNVKRRFVGADTSGFAMAVMGGTGFINYGQNWYFGGTLIASGREAATLTPYGGTRIMQTLPLSESAASDTPTVGGFFGVRLGDRQFGISPEIGIYYDEPALDIYNDDPVLFIPSVTIHGRGLLHDLFQ